jgi:tetratricopeptide (TPR) repeat protein
LETCNFAALLQIMMRMIWTGVKLPKWSMLKIEANEATACTDSSVSRCKQLQRRIPIAIVCVICILSLLISSCNNDDIKSQKAQQGQESELTDLVRKYPDSLLLRENLVQYFRDKGDYEAAIKEAETVLRKDPANARFLNIQATLYFENGDTLKAISSFEKAAAIDPADEYIVSLGSLYAQTRNPKALALADTLLRMPSVVTQKQALFIKGLYYSYAEDKIKAISFFDSCLKIDYRDLLAYREKAICLFDLKKYAAALDVLQKALAVKQTFDEGYYWMGRCYEKLDKRKEAVESYEQALQIDPDYIEAKDALERLK